MSKIYKIVSYIGVVTLILSLINLLLSWIYYILIYPIFESIFILSRWPISFAIVIFCVKKKYLILR